MWRTQHIGSHKRIGGYAKERERESIREAKPKSQSLQRGAGEASQTEGRATKITRSPAAFMQDWSNEIAGLGIS
jgi:hypothetical protein